MASALRSGQRTAVAVPTTVTLSLASSGGHHHEIACARDTRSHQDLQEPPGPRPQERFCPDVVPLAARVPARCTGTVPVRCSQPGQNKRNQANRQRKKAQKLLGLQD